MNTPIITDNRPVNTKNLDIKWPDITNNFQHKNVYTTLGANETITTNRKNSLL